MDDYKVLHRVVRRLAGWAVVSFFSRVHVIGGENVPKDGPLIVTATHHNMMLDPAVLSSAFPHQRILSYWSKASLFANPVMKYILTSTGNIPVERKSQDRRVLFRGTFDALAKGWAVALFPEGTSYTEPCIVQVKDGAAWAALEYTKWARETKSADAVQPLVLVPAAIVYSNKSKYRSDVIMEFGQPIRTDDFMEEFMSTAEGAQRAAVKRLTATLYQELKQATVNAPDWDTLYAARMTRDLLWENEKAIPLDEFVTISQTLVDLFSTPDPTANFQAVRRHLLIYYSLLQSTHLSNSVLASLPLPPGLNPDVPHPLPSRLRTLLVFVKDTIPSLIRLPFFLLPLLFHLPVYAMARMGAKLVEEEEETQAQNKVVFGLLLTMMIYPATFFFLWALLWFSPIGAMIAAGMVYLFAVYHNRLITDNYEHLKRLIGAWRVLVGVWVPKRWDLSLAALTQYTIPFTPPENPWIQRPQEPAPTVPLPTSPGTPGLAPASPTTGQSRRKRRPPTRRLVRHVLRARVQAVHALALFFTQLEHSDSDAYVRASEHLALQFRGRVDDGEDAKANAAMPGHGMPTGWRRTREVLAFLKARGAKIPTLDEGVVQEWAGGGVSSGSGEMSGGEDGGDRTEDEVSWIPAGAK